MKKIILILSLIVSPLFVAANASTMGGTPQLFLEDVSPANLPKTIKAFKAEVKAAGWGILQEHNLAGILSAKGYTLHPAFVLEVCSGKYSAKLLAKDENRYITSMIPCRVAIYQTSTGEVRINRMNTPMMASFLTPEVAAVVTQSAQEMEGVIERTLDQLK